MNKPIVLRSGEWLLPVTIGLRPANLAFINKRDHLGLTEEKVTALSHDLGAAKGVNVFSSTDQGKSFTTVGQAHFPAEQSPCEHMLIERKAGSIWMLVRTLQGIGSAESTDCGRKWSAPQSSGIPHPSTRFFIRRLRSGRLLW